MIHSNFNTNGKRELVRSGNKIIGYLEDRKFIKPVKASKHQLRQPPAWSIDADVFDEEVKPNAVQFIILDRETGSEHQTSVETFYKHCFKFNRGFGDQYALPLRYWTQNGNGHKQLSLWGDGEIG